MGDFTHTPCKFMETTTFQMKGVVILQLVMACYFVPEVS